MQFYSNSEILHKDLTTEMFILDRPGNVSMHPIAGSITALMPQISVSPVVPPVANYKPNPLHMHDCFQLFFTSVESRPHIQTVGTQEIQVPAGGLLLIPPYMPHRIHSIKENYGESCMFSMEFLNGSRESRVRELFFDWGHILPWFNRQDVEALRFIPPRREHAHVQRHMERLEDIHKRIQTVFLKPSSPLNKVYGAEIYAAFDEFALDVREHFYAARTQKELEAFEKYRPPLLAAIDYIYENMGRRITVRELCGVTGFKTAWLSKIFEKIMHIPIVEYVNFTRMQKARMLLINTERSIGDIAAECGYNSPIYFDRVFKHNTGCTPKEYRREYLLEWKD